MVYCGLYPTESKDYENLRDALEKLQLNDAALEYEAETSLGVRFLVSVVAFLDFYIWTLFKNG